MTTQTNTNTEEKEKAISFIKYCYEELNKKIEEKNYCIAECYSRYISEECKKVFEIECSEEKRNKKNKGLK